MGGSIAKAARALYLLNRKSHPLFSAMTEQGQTDKITSAPGSDEAEARARIRQLELLTRVTSSINSGLRLEAVLEKIYCDFKEIIPYDRIGFSLIQNEPPKVRAIWAKSSYAGHRLLPGYEAALKGSSLEKIVQTRQPRIINDLPAYLAEHSSSESTKLVVDEGLRSSLTCPLLIDGQPVGFLFFASKLIGAYEHVHVDTFTIIADQVAAAVEKGRLLSELETQNVHLQNLNDLKNRFLGIAAHDLRGPLAQFSLISEMLLDEDNPIPKEQQRELLSVIKRQSAHLNSLIGGLLDISRIESGKLELHKEPVAVNELLRQVAAEHSIIAGRKKISLILKEIPDGFAVVDRTRIKQVVDNLVSNALKFSLAGTAVIITAEMSGKEWKISISDQGPGLTAEDKSRLFQDFQRLSAAPTGGEKSVGLGLAIARRITEAHGGKIGVDSQPGRGATFWIVI